MAKKIEDTRPFYKKKRFIIIVAIIVLLVITVMYHGIEELMNRKYFKWSELELSKNLPEIQNPYGEIDSDYSDYLNLKIYKVDSNFIKRYKNECIEMGYVVEKEETRTSYEAFNESGYKLTLYFWDDNELWISLEAPEKLEEFVWPTFGLATLIPKPKSSIGLIDYDNSDWLSIKVGDTPRGDYEEYIRLCQEKGFADDYEKHEDKYTASNKDGYMISIEYIGFNKMEINIRKDNIEIEETNDNEMNNGL